MVDTKTSALSAGSALAGTEEFMGVQSGSSVKFTPAQFATYVSANMSPAVIAGGTVTSSTPVVNATQTWNSGGTAFTGIKLNVTDSASATASLLMDLQVGSSSKYAVYKDGSVGQSIIAAQNSQSGTYTLVLSDNGKHILHPAADTTARTWTIPANASVAFAIGSAVTFVNQFGAGTLTIAITSDTMRLAGFGTTGNRTLATGGVATAIKLTSTEWVIFGTGLS